MTATFSESVQQATIAMSVTAAGGTAAPGNITYSDTNKTATFTPSGSLAANTTYNVSLSGAKDTAGNTMTARWAGRSPPPRRARRAARAPSGRAPPRLPVAADPDTAAVEVGVRFRADAERL